MYTTQGNKLCVFPRSVDKTKCSVKFATQYAVSPNLGTALHFPLFNTIGSHTLETGSAYPTTKTKTKFSTYIFSATHTMGLL